MSKGASDFKKIPYVGEATEADLLALGYEGIASLKGADPSRCLNAQRRSDAAAFAARNGASRKCKLASATNGANFMCELYEHNAIKATQRA